MRSAWLTAALVVLASLGPARDAHAQARRTRLDPARLANAIGRIATAARPGVLGVGVAILGTNEQWFLNGDRPLPMQSVFKAPLGAQVLDAADHGRLRLDSTIVLRREDLSGAFSAVSSLFPRRTTWTVAELVTRAVETSDNTAADVLLRRMGGPASLTAWLRARGVQGISVDRYEREQQPEVHGLGRFRPAWANQDSFDRAKLTVPEPARRRAMQAYPEGSRDVLTPRGAIAFLTELEEGRLLSPASTRRLLQMMTNAQTGPRRLRAGLPKGAALAHKTGTGPVVFGVATATNDIGIVTLADGRRIAIVALLSASRANETTREGTLAAVARAVVASLR
jgi:beta-lactamase class A